MKVSQNLCLSQSWKIKRIIYIIILRRINAHRFPSLSKQWQGAAIRAVTWDSIQKKNHKTIHSKSKQIYNPPKHTLTFVPSSCIVNITFVILYEFEVKTLMMQWEDQYKYIYV